MIQLTSEQLGRLLFKAKHEPRRNQKRYLKDLGGEGSAEELDKVLACAHQDPEAVKEAERLEEERCQSAKPLDGEVIGRVAEMLADLRLKMNAVGMSQADMAERCGWPMSVVGSYLDGNKEPGIENLVKMASAVGCVWRLVTTH